MQRFARDTAQTVEHRAFDETDAQIREQRGGVPGVGPVTLLAVQLAPELEKCNWRPSDALGEFRGVADDLEHFGQVLLESCRGNFREPFWRQAFRAETKRGFSRHRHPCSYE